MKSILDKLAFQAQQSKEKAQERTDLRGLEAYLDKFKRLMVQGVLDSLNRPQLHGTWGTSSWEGIRQKVVDRKGWDYFTLPTPKRQKPTYKAPFYLQAVSKLFHAKLYRTENFKFLQELLYIETTRERDLESFDLVWNLLERQVEHTANKDPEDLVYQVLENTCNFFQQLFVKNLLYLTGSDSRNITKNVKKYVEDRIKTFQTSSNAEFDEEGEAYWGVLYFLLRGGCLDEAKHYSQSHPGLQWISRYLESYFRGQGVLENQLMQDLLDALASPDLIDVFKKGVLVILTRNNLEVDELQEISIEDYLWIKLKIVNPVSEEEASNLETGYSNYNVLTLSDFQQTVIETKLEHFEGDRVVYCLALIGSMCMGEAVEFLYNQNLLDQAVHLAIALCLNNMLPVFYHDSSLFEDFEGIKHVNFCKLVSQYSEPFSHSLPNEALKYISLMNSTKAIVSEASKLVIANENYQIILNTEVYIFSSYFRQIVGENIYKECVEAVAEYAANHKAPEAVELFNMIQDFPKILETWVLELKSELKTLEGQWREEVSKGWKLKEERGQFQRCSYVRKKYPGLYNELQSKNIFQHFPDLDKAIQVLEEFLNVYLALSKRYLRQSMSLLAATGLFPIRPLSRRSEIPEKVKSLHKLVKEEIPDMVFTGIEVHSILVNMVQPPEQHELKDDLKDLLMFFGEVGEYLKGNIQAEARMKYLESYVIDIKGKLVLI